MVLFLYIFRYDRRISRFFQLSRNFHADLLSLTLFRFVRALFWSVIVTVHLNRNYVMRSTIVVRVLFRNFVSSSIPFQEFQNGPRFRRRTNRTFLPIAEIEHHHPRRSLKHLGAHCEQAILLTASTYFPRRNPIGKSGIDRTFVESCRARPMLSFNSSDTPRK